MNTPLSTSAEINKMIAEKQTIYVEQKASIKAYKRVLDNQKYDEELITQKMKTIEVQNEMLTDKIAQMPMESDRLWHTVDLLESNTEQNKLEIKLLEQSMQTLSDECNANQKRDANIIAKMTEDLISTQTGFSKYKSLIENNQQLQDNIVKLQASCKTDRDKIKVTEETKTFECNKKILQLVTRIMKLKTLLSLKIEHEFNSNEYKKSTEELMGIIIVEDETETVETLEDETFAFAVETNTINSEETFKVPIAPPSIVNPPTKVTVLQDVNFPAPKVTAEKEQTLETKRRSDSIHNPLILNKKQKSMEIAVQPVSTNTNDNMSFDAYSFHNSGEVRSDFFSSGLNADNNFDFGNFGTNENNSESEKDNMSEPGFLDVDYSNKDNDNFVFNF